MFELDVAEGDVVVGRAVRDLGLPRDALIGVVLRDGQALPPRGSTVIRDGDRLYVLARTHDRRAMQELIESWQEAAPGRPAVQPAPP